MRLQPGGTRKPSEKDGSQRSQPIQRADVPRSGNGARCLNMIGDGNLSPHSESMDGFVAGRGEFLFGKPRQDMLVRKQPLQHDVVIKLEAA